MLGYGADVVDSDRDGRAPAHIPKHLSLCHATKHSVNVQPKHCNNALPNKTCLTINKKITFKISQSITIKALQAEKDRSTVGDENKSPTLTWTLTHGHAEQTTTAKFSAKRPFSLNAGNLPPTKRRKPLPTPTNPMQLQISPPQSFNSNENLLHFQYLPFPYWTNQTCAQTAVSDTNHQHMPYIHHNGFSLPPTPAASPDSMINLNHFARCPQTIECNNEQQKPEACVQSRQRSDANWHLNMSVSSSMLSAWAGYGTAATQPQAFVPRFNVMQIPMQMWVPGNGPTERFNTYEMQEAYKRAVHFVCQDKLKHELRPFWVFYRCKPESYFTAMFNVSAGEPRMLLSLKDNTGHERSPLNGALHGVFFMCRLVGVGCGRNALPHTSIYGDHRVAVAHLVLLHPHAHNLYFADFYCFKHKHYVLLVSARIGSPADHFCQNKLPQLDMKCNPFLTVECDVNTGLYYAKAEHDKVLVELFYTEEVPFRLCGPVHRIAPCPPTNYYKIKNNKLCTVCNAPSTSTCTTKHVESLVKKSD